MSVLRVFTHVGILGAEICLQTGRARCMVVAGERKKRVVTMATRELRLVRVKTQLQEG